MMSSFAHNGLSSKNESSSSSDGKGSVNRQEALSTNVAGVVTQVLPNGNLVIEGRQEIRVNFEIRELIVAGVVRPEDERRIAVKVINHLGDEVMKVFRV